jgi:hypothetical protein
LTVKWKVAGSNADSSAYLIYLQLWAVWELRRKRVKGQFLGGNLSEVKEKSWRVI